MKEKSFQNSRVSSQSAVKVAWPLHNYMTFYNYLGDFRHSDIKFCHSVCKIQEIKKVTISFFF